MSRANNNQKNSLFGSGFSLRRLLVEGARTVRGGPSAVLTSGILLSGNSSNGSSSSNRQQNYDIEKGEGTSKDYNKQHFSESEKSSTLPLMHNTSILSSQPNIKESSSTLTLNSSNQLNSSRKKLNEPHPSITPQRSDSTGQFFCPICYNTPVLPNEFYILFTCKHVACRVCLERYLKNEINESRTNIACPQCSEAMNPSDIELLLRDEPEFIYKYQEFMIRRFLLSNPDSRWCPAPDCSYAVIAQGCASCPRIRCQRPGCGLLFCYHCKAEWHPDQTCDAARASRNSPLSMRLISQLGQDNRDDIKPCPRCQVLIVKLDDGSCNHMVCSICNAEFCWLCMKEISDLHYLSPSGCTFWGKKPWSRKKKLMWQLGTLVGAPVGIALLAGICVPAMIIGIPVWVGKKIYARYKQQSKHKRNCAVVSGVLGSILISPVLAGLAVAIGVPILLFYVYGVVPVSLCRASCGVTPTRDGFKFDFDEDEEVDIVSNRNQMQNQQSDGASVDAVSRLGATSIGEVSLSVASGSHVGVAGNCSVANFTGATINSKFDRESTTALAGSINGQKLEIQADVCETSSGNILLSEKISNDDNVSTESLAGSIY